MLRATRRNRRTTARLLGLALALLGGPAAANGGDPLVPCPQAGGNAGFPEQGIPEQVRVEQPKLPTAPLQEPPPPVSATSRLLDVEVLPPLQRSSRSSPLARPPRR